MFRNAGRNGIANHLPSPIRMTTRYMRACDCPLLGASGFRRSRYFLTKMIRLCWKGEPPESTGSGLSRPSLILRLDPLRDLVIWSRIVLDIFWNQDGSEIYPVSYKIVMVTNIITIKELHCKLHFFLQIFRTMFPRKSAILESYPSCCVAIWIDEKVVADASM